MRILYSKKILKYKRLNDKFKQKEEENYITRQSWFKTHRPKDKSLGQVLYTFTCAEKERVMLSTPDKNAKKAFIFHPSLKKKASNQHTEASPSAKSRFKLDHKMQKKKFLFHFKDSLIAVLYARVMLPVTVVVWHLQTQARSLSWLAAGNKKKLYTYTLSSLSLSHFSVCIFECLTRHFMWQLKKKKREKTFFFKQ